jgi:hypothetical protein
LEEYQQMLEDATEDNEIALMKVEIAQTEKVLRIIRRALGETEKQNTGSKLSQLNLERLDRSALSPRSLRRLRQHSHLATVRPNQARI